MKNYKKSKRYYYFRGQKIQGGILVVLAVLSIIITGGDGTAALLIGPLGVWLMLTKKMVIMNDYYYEVKEKEYLNKWKGKES